MAENTEKPVHGGVCPLKASTQEFANVIYHDLQALFYTTIYNAYCARQTGGYGEDERAEQSEFSSYVERCADDVLFKADSEVRQAYDALQTALRKILDEFVAEDYMDAYQFDRIKIHREPQKAQR